jgi:hypothetical protein
MKPEDKNRHTKLEVITLVIAAVTAIIFTVIALSMLRKPSSTIRQSPTAPTISNTPTSSPATQHNDDNDDDDDDNDNDDDDDDNDD